MVTLPMLWLPIVLAAVTVLVAGYVMWTVLPHHKGDWGEIPGEDAFLGVLQAQKVGRGQYRFPYCRSSEEMRSPEIVDKYEAGLAGFLIMRAPGTPRMGRSLLQHLLYGLVISVFVAYLAGRTLAPGSEYLAVFRVAGTAAILGYAGALAPGAIWFGRTWGSTFKEILDGVLYGLLTAGVFGWLWPR